MRKSPKKRAKVTTLGGLVMCLLLTRAQLSLAHPRPCVEVKIETEWHVGPPHTVEEKEMNLIFRPLKLTYHIPPMRDGHPLTLRIAPGPAKAGAGLVVDHTARSGTRTTQSLAAEPWWFSKAEILQIQSSSCSTYFDIWVLPGTSFDFSELGIYRISYIHPWAEMEENRDSPIFRSNALTIACVTQERSDQLHMTLSQKPKLALASYAFKNPPSAIETPKYRRSVSKIIDEAITNGSKQDEVLFLLGSPDIISNLSTGQQEIHGCDETWLFETSPVGGYGVRFKNGRVVWKGEFGDRDSP